MTVYGYIRVSTDKQTLANQEFEINNFCTREKIKADKLVTETISGTKDFEKRKLGKLLRKLQPQDILICTEISRLGRNLMQIMTILNICLKKNVQVWTIKDNYRLGTDIQSKVLAFAFGLAAEIERNLISQRTREALNRIKQNGTKLGRPKGVRNTKHVMDGKEDDVIDLLSKGITLTKIAKLIGVSTSTVQKFMKKRYLKMI